MKDTILYLCVFAIGFALVIIGMTIVHTRQMQLSQTSRLQGWKAIIAGGLIALCGPVFVVFCLLLL